MLRTTLIAAALLAASAGTAGATMKPFSPSQQASEYMAFLAGKVAESRGGTASSETIKTVLLDHFQKLDKNDDGALGEGEHAPHVLSVMDHDGDGRVVMFEWIWPLQGVLPILDKNGDGGVSKAETRIFRGLPPKPEDAGDGAQR